MVELTAEARRMVDELAAGGEAGGGARIVGQDVIPLNEVARMFAKAGGKRISKVSLWRWATHGLKRRRGPGRCRLETMKLGGVRYTSRAAIERFAAELDGRSVVGLQVAGERFMRSPAVRRAMTARASKELIAAGFMEPPTAGEETADAGTR